MGMNPTDTLREFYLKKNTVFLPDIGSRIVGQIIGDLAKIAMSSPDHIDMVISSSGGITDGGFAIAQFIEFELDIPVHARVHDRCHSAATYVLLVCKERVANELATFVIHRQTSSIRIDHSSGFDAEVDGWKADNAETHQKQIRFYSKKLGLPDEETEKLLDRGSQSTDNKFNAKAALSIGLLTHILELS